MQTTITAHDGHTFSAYTAKPAPSSSGGPNGAGIIVIQEIFGVNPDVRKKCDDWAAKGYLAMAPDIFSRQEHDVQITPKTKEDWDRAFVFMNGLNIDTAVDDIKATLVKMREECSGPSSPSGYAVASKIGTVGYCLGGKLAYLMATRSDVDASVSYYGGGIENLLNESNQLKKPILLHYAEEDSFITKDKQEAVKVGLGHNPHVTIYSYAGVDHAFTRTYGDHYNETAAKLANGRTADFFAHHLTGVKAAAA